MPFQPYITSYNINITRFVIQVRLLPGETGENKWWGTPSGISINQSINPSIDQSTVHKFLQWPKWQQTLQGPLRSHTTESPGMKNKIGAV